MKKNFYLVNNNRFTIELQNQKPENNPVQSATLNQQGNKSKLL